MGETAAAALGESKSEAALPALREQLKKLEGDRSRRDWSPLFAATKTSVVRLSHANPVEPLLELIEDPRNDEELRDCAASILRSYDVTAVMPRLLKVLREDPDPLVKAACVTLLMDAKLDGLTETFGELALISEDNFFRGWTTLPDTLLEALNKRLGRSFRTMEEMRAHLRTLKAFGNR